jgi:hypothetical protein
MPVLTVRISEKEKKKLARRVRKSGLTTGALVRQLLSEESLTTAEELLEEMNRRMGDSSLRVRRRR